jgi:hypothetical protein
MKRCECGKLIFKYGRKGFKIEVCYRCGNIKYKSKLPDEELNFILTDLPLVLPFLIKEEYLKPM